jgi:hypothetical protein
MLGRLNGARAGGIGAVSAVGELLSSADRFPAIFFLKLLSCFSGDSDDLRSFDELFELCLLRELGPI